MNKISTAATTGLLMLSLGCSTFRDSQQSLSVNVIDPPHAKIWVNNKYQGESSAQISVQRDKQVYVLVKKDGYQTQEKLIGHHLNTTGWLDCFGAYFLFLPFIGIMSPGHVSLDETYVTMSLSPDPDAAAQSNAAKPEPNSIAVMPADANGASTGPNTITTDSATATATATPATSAPPASPASPAPKNNSPTANPSATYSTPNSTYMLVTTNSPAKP